MIHCYYVVEYCVTKIIRTSHLLCHISGAYELKVKFHNRFTFPSSATDIFSWRACFSVTVFRWFKFTLKPPYSGAHECSLLAIWDTSHWNFFVKFGLRTAWDISYDILLSLLKFVNFWRLQGCLSILAKIGCLQKIKVFSMKEQWGFDATWGFRQPDH